MSTTPKDLFSTTPYSHPPLFIFTIYTTAMEIFIFFLCLLCTVFSVTRFALFAIRPKVLEDRRKVLAFNRVLMASVVLWSLLAYALGVMVGIFMITIR